MSQATRLSIPTPPTGDASGNTGWGGLKGVVAFVSGKGKGHEYRFDAPYFHHGYPTYVARGPQGRECRVFREGQTWYSNGVFGDFHKHVKCEHIEGGDPNLPPCGTGWVSCENGWPSSLALQVVPGFERQLKALQGLNSGLFAPYSASRANKAALSTAQQAAKVPAAMPYTGPIARPLAGGSQRPHELGHASLSDKIAGLQTPNIHGENGTNEWDPLRGQVILINAKGREYRYHEPFVHHGYPVFVYSHAASAESRVFREGNYWYYSCGRGGFRKNAKIAHVQGSDPNLPPLGKGWVDSDSDFPFDALAFEIAPQFEAALKSIRGGRGDQPQCSQSDPINEIETIAIPSTGTLEEISAAHEARLSIATRMRVKALAKEDATCALAQAARDALKVQLEEAEAKLQQANTHRAAILKEHDSIVETIRGEYLKASSAAQTFMEKVQEEGLDELTVTEVFELLHQLNTPVSLETLKSQDVTGSVLVGLTEAEMLSVFKVKTLGERRRLAWALRRLASRESIESPSTAGWNTTRVCSWLVEVGLESLQQKFRDESIDGEALLMLNRDDLELLGVTTLGGKATVMGKIEILKQQLLGSESRAQALGSDEATQDLAIPAEDRDRILEQCLRDDSSLADVIATARTRRRSQTPAILCCPITKEVMQEPVVAMDGHTYERAAISAWFVHNNTSPVTGTTIAPTIVPNANLTAQIASWRS